jgi:hypothetical protein
VVSAKGADRLGFTPQSIGDEIRIDGVAFTVVGVLDDADGFGSGAALYITQDAARSLFSKSPYISVIRIQAASQEAVSPVEYRVEQFLRYSQNVREDDDAKFSIFNQAALQNTIRIVTGTLGILITGIAVISCAGGNWNYEHHVGLGARAHPRDWCSPGHWG